MNPRKLLWVAACCVAVARSAVAGESEPARFDSVAIRGTVRLPNGSADQALDLDRVVVHLDSHPQLDRLPPDNRRPVMAQPNKLFVGDLLVVWRGTTVEFPNRDPFSHNVFSRSRAASFDLDRYPAGQSKSYTFSETGIVQLFCNIHPDMKATIVVVPNRYFARADRSGRFALDRVPPGSYQLVAWHERFEEQRQPIQVAGAGAQDFVITLQSSSRRAAAAPAAPARRAPYGVERGLGIKRERLNLPVVGNLHPAP
jgi:hypothetical protein